MNPRDAFKFCPRCGNKLEPQEESLQCVNCGFHFYINPVPCNGAIIENEKGEVLLVKRKFEPQKGYWDLPGGFVRAGEDLEQSVKREVMEEIGVQVEIQRIIGIYVDTYLYQEIANKTFGVVVSAKITGGTLHSADDVEEYKYFPKEQVLQQTIAFPGIKKAFEDYLQKQNHNS